MRRWIVSSMLVASVVALNVRPAAATKPQPPPTPPKIVATLTGFGFLRAIASDGSVYDVSRTYPAPSACSVTLTGATLAGRIFPGEPVSPIASAILTSDGMVVTLENGDVWHFHDGDTTPPCNRIGTFMGNIFTVSGGAALRAPDMSLPDRAPAASVPVEPESPEPRGTK
jgi:hypothetical protein